MVRADSLAGVAQRQTVDTFETAFVETLRAVLEEGQDVVAGDGLSIGSGRTSRELLDYSFTLADGRDRILSSRPISGIGAVGRFVWMLSGSDRLADVAFYEPKVGAFTDDGLSVPGSDYGARLFRPRPGLDQVREAARILQEEPGSRRAAAAVFHPEDAGRASHDIPCTFGLFWHARDGMLHATTVMRSNNAWTLLPYNVFEFSLLAEILALSSGLEVGRYHHSAVSMHLYEEHLAAASGILAEDQPIVPRMPAVPFGDVWTNIKELLALEVQIRYRAAAMDHALVISHLQQAADMGPFWSDLAGVIIAAAVRNQELVDSAQDVIESLSEPLKSLVTLDLSGLLEPSVSKPDTARLWLQLLRGQIQPPPPGGND